MRHKFVFVFALALLVVAGCAPAAAPASATTPAQAEAPAEDVMILIDGSSTVAPITSAVAEEFQRENPNVRVPVGISGTGGGFKKFCAGETDIQDASRPIKASEAEECAANGIKYIELPVAYDGMAVMVNPANDWTECLTVEELNNVWRPEAEDVVMNWSQVRADFPDRTLGLYGAGVDSGTYDYFTEAIMGKSGASRGDFLPSEDDNVLVQGIAGDENALGFFGLAYYEQNADKLKLVAVDGGNGCVLPNAETVGNSTYTPLSRPIFIYVNKARSEEEPEIVNFIGFYMTNGAMLSAEVGYIAMPAEIYSAAQARFDARTAGSIYEGLESTVGVSLVDLLLGQ